MGLQNKGDVTRFPKWNDGGPCCRILMGLKRETHKIKEKGKTTRGEHER